MSKTAGFTGTRLGYTVIPKALKRNGMNLNEMWVRNRTTKTNGVSYIIQKGGAAVFTEEGQRQIHENIQIYKKNAKILMKALDQIGIWYCGGKNAPYIWMRCPKGMKSWEFFDYLLHKIQVVGTPGEGFGAAGEGTPFFNIWFAGRYERSGRKDCNVIFKIINEKTNAFILRAEITIPEDLDYSGVFDKILKKYTTRL